MKFKSLIVSLRMFTLLGGIHLAGVGLSLAVETSPTINPDLHCEECGCFNFSAAKLTAGGTDVEGSSATPSEPTKVSPDAEGRIHLKLDMPPRTSCADCSETKLKVVVEQKEGSATQGAKPMEIDTSSGASSYEWDLDTVEWENPPVLVRMFVTRTGSSPRDCYTFAFTFGGCDSCKDCSQGGPKMSGAGDVQGKNGSVEFTIPVGVSNFGSSSAELAVHLDSTDNPGSLALKLNAWSGITKTLDSAGDIASVTTQSSHARVVSAPTTADPFAYQVYISSDPTNSSTIASSIFRTVTVEELAGGIFQVKSVTNGVTRIMQWTQSGSTWTFVSGSSTGGDGLRKVEKTVISSDSFFYSCREKVYEQDPDDTTAPLSYLLVSDEIREYVRIGGIWKINKTRKDPDGANLVSTWTYFLTNEITGADTYAGVGLLKDYERYDGYFEHHNYWDFGTRGRAHVVEMPYGSGSMWRTTEWDPATREVTVTDMHNGLTLAKTNTVWSRPGSVIAKTVKNYINATDYLTTVYYYHQAGTSGIGNKPLSISYPDGTGVLYQYSINGLGHRVITVDRGAVSTSTIVEGTRSTTRINPDGNEEEVLVTAISAGSGNGVVLEHWIATAIDTYGRPTTLAWFPTLSTTWNTVRTYDCCGLASETDKYGNLTQYQYDALHRRIKTNRLGVTEAAKYQGLTVSSYRYPETVTGGVFASGLSNEISRSVSNVAGTLAESWGPSPQSGSLVKLSTATTTYRNPVGTVVDLGAAIGSKMVKEVIQVTDDGTTVPKQSSLYSFDGSLDRTWGDLEPAVRYVHTVNTLGVFASAAAVEGAVSDTSGTLRETRNTYSDWLGRPKREFITGRGNILFYYNPYGQLERTVDSDGVTTRYQYNTKGERTITANKLNGTTASITWGTDRVTSVETVPAVRSGSIDVLRTITKVWKDGDTSPTGGTIVSTVDRTPDGLKTWTSRIGVANEKTTTLALAGGGTWTETTVGADGVVTRAYYANGRLVASTVWKSGTNPPTTAPANIMSVTTAGFISGESYVYDGLGRRTNVRDARTGLRTTGYKSTICDAIESETDAGFRATAYLYDHRGRRTEVRLPGYTTGGGSANAPYVTTTNHYPDGSVSLVDGGQTYKSAYAYDYAGRMKTLTTYGGSTATTTWNYDAGLLVSKTYPDGPDAGSSPDPGPTYTYTAAGRLKKRIWARGDTTRYDYDIGGRLGYTRYFTAATSQTTVDAAATGNDPVTPDAAFSRDALNRLSSASNDYSTITYGYDPSNLSLATETVSIDPDGSLDPDGSGPLTSRSSVSKTFQRYPDSIGRPTGYELKNGSTVEADVEYSWGASDGRLETVGADLAGTWREFDFTYENKSLTLPGVMIGPVMSTYWFWKTDRDVLDERDNLKSSSPYDVVSATWYSVNGIGQRTQAEQVIGFWPYSDSWVDWAYDSKGQLTSADSLLNSSPNPQATRGYSYDGIGNRLRSSRTTTSPGSATGSNLAAYYADSAGTTEGGNALNQFEKVSLYGASPVAVIYDADGNQTAGPFPNGNTGDRWWDGENRMVRSQIGSADTYYAHDPFGRRVAKFQGGGSGMTGTIYFYDSWNVAAECSISSSSYPLARTYTWGPDLSGTFQGAGGVGGLLAVENEAGMTPVGVYYPAYDGNGNITEYMDSSGNLAAHFEYDPFGETVVVTGGLTAAQFNYRFSTKPRDTETGLYYYGYRYYDSVTGRWPSRDPIEERGGVNLYGFVRNDGISRIDALGLHYWAKLNFRGSAAGNQSAPYLELSTSWKCDSASGYLTLNDISSADDGEVVSGPTLSNSISGSGKEGWAKVYAAFRNKTTAEAMVNGAGTWATNAGYAGAAGGGAVGLFTGGPVGAATVGGIAGTVGAVGGAVGGALWYSDWEHYDAWMTIKVKARCVCSSGSKGWKLELDDPEYYGGSNTGHTWKTSP